MSSRRPPQTTREAQPLGRRCALFALTRLTPDFTNGFVYANVLWALGHCWRWPACARGPVSAAKPG
eukprot:14030968-Alexandrium_andersonii.AAC.1